ncbi:MAG: kynureninase [Acidimicrobiales bacterium]
MTPPTRTQCIALDNVDPLGRFRDEFDLPDGLIYLLGNSLGPLPRRVTGRLAQTLRDEWGKGLTRSWGDAGWWDLPVTLGAKLAPIIGAEPSEVLVCDSTSINTFKVVCAAAAMRPERRTILTDAENFPTDLYLVEAAAKATGGLAVRHVADPARLADELDDDVGVVELSHVDYRTARLLPMRQITADIHAAGAIVVWDLAHSAGAVEVGLNAADADFAVGCTYKYLNGGPGAPAYLYVAQRHQASAISPLPGWNGHARPFAFVPEYEPADGVRRFACGSPPVLSYAALAASLSLFEELDLVALFAKARALSGVFIDLLEPIVGATDLQLASPREPDERGSHVALRHPDAAALVVELESRGVLVDLREPDFIRAGIAPLYLRYVDIFDAAAAVADTIRTDSGPRPRALR